MDVARDDFFPGSRLAGQEHGGFCRRHPGGVRQDILPWLGLPEDPVPTLRLEFRRESLDARLEDIGPGSHFGVPLALDTERLM